MDAYASKWFGNIYPSTKMATNTFLQGSTVDSLRASANLQADGASNLYFLEICQFAGLPGRVFSTKVNPFFFPAKEDDLLSPRKKKSQVLLRNNMTTTLHKMNTFWI